MATMAQIEAGIVRWIDCELAPKIPVNIPNGQIKKIAAVAGAVYAVKKNLSVLLSSPAMKTFGIVGADGEIDVEGLAEAVTGRVDDAGFTVTVPILGDLKFFREDVDRIRQYITGG